MLCMASEGVMKEVERGVEALAMTEALEIVRKVMVVVVSGEVLWIQLRSGVDGVEYYRENYNESMTNDSGPR